MKVAIIGASAAGLSCLDVLQRFSLARTITLISEEPYPPYCRCLLTHRLAGELTPAQMTLWEPSREGPEISLLLGRRVASLDVRNQEALLDDGRRIPYDRLLLATGAEPIKPSYCDEGKNIFTLRTLADTEKIERAFGPQALVIGGGLVGIKAALALKDRGAAVEMVISSAYPLSQVLDRETGEIIGGALAWEGLSLHLGEEVREAGRDNGRVVFALQSGKELTANLALVGKGVNPRTELAQAAGLALGTGIKVNEFLETSVPAIYAAGDCCESQDLVRGVPRVNALWPVAAEQGWYAAWNMAGQHSPYPGALAMNNLKTPSFHLITAGILHGMEGIEVHSRFSPAQNQFRKLACREGRPVGMAFFNCPEEAGPFVHLIRQGLPLTLDPARLLSGETSPADLWKTWS